MATDTLELDGTTDEMEGELAGERRGRADLGRAQEIAPGVAFLRTLMVNLYFLGERAAGDRGWVLVDTGFMGSAGMVVKAAAQRFGADARPAAIVLTHGHFDHVGSLETLAERWDCPVYAHRLELPYVTGRASYPPMDPSVGGGSQSFLSPLFPRGPSNVGARARALPEDFSVPFAEGWRWIATPGHSPGHVSLFRDSDRVLIAGDAVITTKQESLGAVLVQRPEVRRPPAYATTDWQLARTSVEAIAALEPELLATGHGVPMRGPQMQEQLATLAREFARAIPARGRYVWQPVIADETGPVQVPPPVPVPQYKYAAMAAVALVAGYALFSWLRRDDDAGAHEGQLLLTEGDVVEEPVNEVEFEAVPLHA